MENTDFCWVACGPFSLCVCRVQHDRGSPVEGGESSTSPSQRDPIQIATKPMTEQYILGEMLGLVITDSTGYPVEITKGSAAVLPISSPPWNGGISIYTRNIHPAAGRWY